MSSGTREYRETYPLRAGTMYVDNFYFDAGCPIYDEVLQVVTNGTAYGWPCVCACACACAYRGCLLILKAIRAILFTAGMCPQSRQPARASSFPGSGGCVGVPPPPIFFQPIFPPDRRGCTVLCFIYDWCHVRSHSWRGVGCAVPALFPSVLISTAPMVLRSQTAACSSCKRSATRHARPTAASPTAWSASIPTPGC